MPASVCSERVRVSLWVSVSCPWVYAVSMEGVPVYASVNVCVNERVCCRRVRLGVSSGCILERMCVCWCDCFREWVQEAVACVNVCVVGGCVLCENVSELASFGISHT